MFFATLTPTLPLVVVVHECVLLLLSCQAESTGNVDEAKDGEGGAPKTRESTDAGGTPAAGTEGGEPSKADPGPETPTPMETDEVEQLE